METTSHTLDSTLENSDAAETIVLDFARRAGLTERSTARIGLAVREIFTNAVIHGNRYDARKKVVLEVRLAVKQIEIVICDEGEGFDPRRVPDPLSAEGVLRPSGRGLLLARMFTDECDIRPGDARGTRVTLVKHVRPYEAEWTSVA
jgi:serine/threonine-protein kinase RsbW